MLIAKLGCTHWTITNLAAILLAKKLDAFSAALARKAPRIVIYESINVRIQVSDTGMSEGMETRSGEAAAIKACLRKLKTERP